MSDNKYSDSLENGPLFRPITALMQVDFVFDHKGGAWLLHDKSLPNFIDWAEYDGTLETLTLVTREGKIQDLGTKIPVGAGHYIERAMELTLLQVEGDKIVNSNIIPIVARDTTLN